MKGTATVLERKKTNQHSAWPKDALHDSLHFATSSWPWHRFLVSSEMSCGTWDTLPDQTDMILKNPWEICILLGSARGLAGCLSHFQWQGVCVFGGTLPAWALPGCQPSCVAHRWQSPWCFKFQTGCITSGGSHCFHVSSLEPYFR